MQVDLLVQTEGVAWIVEVKRKAGLWTEVARKLAQKAARLPVRDGVSVRTALVHAGRLSPSLGASDDIDRLVSAREPLGLPLEPQP